MMATMHGLRSMLARMGLVAAPLEPHTFESAMQLLSHPRSAGPSVATVPHIVTPTSSDERCERCDRTSNDPIHRIPEG